MLMEAAVSRTYGQCCVLWFLSSDPTLVRNCDGSYLGRAKILGVLVDFSCYPWVSDWFRLVVGKFESLCSCLLYSSIAVRTRVEAREHPHQ